MSDGSAPPPPRLRYTREQILALKDLKYCKTMPSGIPTVIIRGAVLQEDLAGEDARAGTKQPAKRGERNTDRSHRDGDCTSDRRHEDRGDRRQPHDERTERKHEDTRAERGEKRAEGGRGDREKPERRTNDRERRTTDNDRERRTDDRRREPRDRDSHQHTEGGERLPAWATDDNDASTQWKWNSGFSKPGTPASSSVTAPVSAVTTSTTSVQSSASATTTVKATPTVVETPAVSQITSSLAKVSLPGLTATVPASALGNVDELFTHLDHKFLDDEEEDEAPVQSRFGKWFKPEPTPSHNDTEELAFGSVPVSSKKSVDNGEARGSMLLNMIRSSPVVEPATVPSMPQQSSTSASVLMSMAELSHSSQPLPREREQHSIPPPSTQSSESSGKHMSATELFGMFKGISQDQLPPIPSLTNPPQPRMPPMPQPGMYQPQMMMPQQGGQQQQQGGQQQYYPPMPMQMPMPGQRMIPVPAFRPAHVLPVQQQQQHHQHQQQPQQFQPQFQQQQLPQQQMQMQPQGDAGGLARWFGALPQGGFPPMPSMPPMPPMSVPLHELEKRGR